MRAVLIACFGGFCFGALGPTLRLGLQRVQDAELGAFHSSAMGLPFAILIAAGFGSFNGAALSDVWPFMALGVVVPGISQPLFVRAVRDIGASRSVIITAMAPLWAGFAAVVFLGEPFRVGLLVGALLVVAGGAALAWERIRPADFHRIGVLWALSGVGMFAARDVVSRWVTSDRHVPGPLAATALLSGAALAQLVYLLLVRRGRRPIRQIADSALAFLPAGLSFGVGYCALLSAFEYGKVTVVSPLNATYALWGVVFSALLLRRTEALNRHTVLAALLVVSGSALVAATR